MTSPTLDAEELSVEFFVSEASDGSVAGVMMSVPSQCGLHTADSLRIDGTVMLAMQGGTVLPIDLPELSSANCLRLGELAASGQDLVVGEFTACGLANSYFLQLSVVNLQ